MIFDFKLFNKIKRFFGKILPATFWGFAKLRIKASPIFGFAKSSQIQNQLSIKPNAQIRCSSCCAIGHLERNFDFMTTFCYFIS